MSIPKRVLADLQAAELLETQQAELIAAGPQALADVSDLIAPPAPNEPPIATPQAPPPVPPTPPKGEDFEQKYKTLQGMYSADVTALKRTVAESLAATRSLVEQVSALQQAKPAVPDAPVVDPKDTEQFGADLIEMVQRYVERRAGELEGRVSILEGKVNGVTSDTAENKQRSFYVLLRQLVPQWQEINGDQRWLAWLAVQDDVYGASRQAALDNAFQALDAQRVANIFNAFVKSLPVDPPAASLENQQAPSSVASPPPPAAPAPKPFLSATAITQFYNEVAKGRYAGREAEMNAKEHEINLAVAENRVR